MQPRPLNPAPALADELPLAISFNGISHAVMLCTPADLEDFALGFAFSEGLIQSAADFLDVEFASHAKGMVAQITSTARAQAAHVVQRKARMGLSGCGLCGVESLEALSDPAPLPSHALIGAQALSQAARVLPALQLLNAQSGGVHAAAWCDNTGAIALVREDVGRHNALDKLIGALLKSKPPPELHKGFVLMTSRASYELVHKCARAGIGALACTSAPTRLAVELANRSGLQLYAFVREDRATLYSQSP